MKVYIYINILVKIALDNERYLNICGRKKKKCEIRDKSLLTHLYSHNVDCLVWQSRGGE